MSNKVKASNKFQKSLLVASLLLGSASVAVASGRGSCSTCTVPNVTTYLNKEIASNVRDTSQTQQKIDRLTDKLANLPADPIPGKDGNFVTPEQLAAKIQGNILDKQSDLTKLATEAAVLSQYQRLNSLGLLSLVVESKGHEGGHGGKHDRGDRDHHRERDHGSKHGKHGKRDHCEFDFVVTPAPVNTATVQRVIDNRPTEKFLQNGVQTETLDIGSLQFTSLDGTQTNVSNVSELPPGVKWRTNIYFRNGAIRMD